MSKANAALRGILLLRSMGLRMAGAASVAFVLWASAATAAGKEGHPADAGQQGQDIEYVEEEPHEETGKPPIERENEPPPPDAVQGALVLSNNDRVQGMIHLTRDASLRLYDPERKRLLSVSLAELTRIEQAPVVERMEKEWRWLENANDRKVYTGKEYPMRELETVLHMKDGRTLRGSLTALIFVSSENGRQRFVLHKRQKGDAGTKLSDLIYVTLVDFHPPRKEPEGRGEESPAR
jgi:hypothetical protein